MDESLWKVLLDGNVDVLPNLFEKRRDMPCYTLTAKETDGDVQHVQTRGEEAEGQAHTANEASHEDQLTLAQKRHQDRLCQ